MNVTPCIGICSTTYGDLVCRGCKRYAHEIVDWNRYGEGQHDVVCQRLTQLRDASVSEFIEVKDEAALRRAGKAIRLPISSQRTVLTVAYEVLRRSSRIPQLDDLGLARSSFAAGVAPERLFGAIDREFYTRAVAVYERSFHTVAQ